MRRRPMEPGPLIIHASATERKYTRARLQPQLLRPPAPVDHLRLRAAAAHAGADSGTRPPGVTQPPRVPALAPGTRKPRPATGRTPHSRARHLERQAAPRPWPDLHRDPLPALRPAHRT